MARTAQSTRSTGSAHSPTCTGAGGEPVHDGNRRWRAAKNTVAGSVRHLQQCRRDHVAAGGQSREGGMKIKRIEHIAIAVDDLDGMAGMLRDKFGIEVEYSEEIARNRTRLAMLPVGESYIELLQGMAPNSRAAEWIAQKGQSLFHICFEVDDIDAALAELKAKGTPLLNETPIIGHGNCRIAFLDPKATGNILFELAEMPPNGMATASGRAAAH